MANSKRLCKLNSLHPALRPASRCRNHGHKNPNCYSRARGSHTASNITHLCHFAPFQLPSSSVSHSQAYSCFSFRMLHPASYCCCHSHQCLTCYAPGYHALTLHNIKHLSHSVVFYLPSSLVLRSNAYSLSSLQNLRPVLQLCSHTHIIFTYYPQCHDVQNKHRIKHVSYSASFQLVRSSAADLYAYSLLSSHTFHRATHPCSHTIVQPPSA